jgi:hypothetical protein
MELLQHRRRGRGRSAALVLLLPVVALVAGCGDDDEDTSSSTSAPGEEVSVCDARDDLDQSVDALGDVELREDGVTALTGAVAVIDESLRSLDGAAEAAQADVADEVAAAQESVDALEAAIEDLGEGATASEAVASVSTAITEVANSAGELRTALADECGE